MKIIISENQFKRILIENEEYINYLLDKISNKGINSLSGAEKKALDRSSNKEKEDIQIIDGDMYVNGIGYDRYISKEYQDTQHPISDTSTDRYRMFISEIKKHNFPKEIYVNDTVWKIDLVEEMSGTHILLSNDKDNIYVTPFWEGSEDIIIGFNDEHENMEIPYPPDTQEEMSSFVNELFSWIIPEMVDYF